MKNNRAGKYRQRLTLMAPPAQETFDTVGQPIASFAAVGTYWGEVVPTSGKEQVAADSVKHVGSHTVTMRYPGSTPITTRHQITLKGRTLNIININDTEERGRQLVLLCQEVT